MLHFHNFLLQERIHFSFYRAYLRSYRGGKNRTALLIKYLWIASSPTGKLALEYLPPRKSQRRTTYLPSFIFMHIYYLHGNSRPTGEENLSDMQLMQKLSKSVQFSCSQLEGDPPWWAMLFCAYSGARADRIKCRTYIVGNASHSMM